MNGLSDEFAEPAATHEHDWRSVSDHRHCHPTEYERQLCIARGQHYDNRFEVVEKPERTAAKHERTDVQP